MPLSSQDCSHCGLPVPAAWVAPAGQPQFCCHGCRGAHALIHACGLEGYYTLPRASDTERVAADLPELRYAEFDRPQFLEAHSRPGPDGDRIATLGVDGMHCAACLWLLERLPRAVTGVHSARVDWRRSTLEVRWSPDRTSLARVAQGVAQLGYRPFPLRTARDAPRNQAQRRRLVALAVAFAAAGNNMLIAIALYLGMFSYMQDNMLGLLRWTSCIVGMFSLLWPGREFFRGALGALRTRTPHMDLPVALGLSIGGIAGLINTVRGVGEIYFDTLSVLVFLLLLGRWLQVRQQHQAASAVDILYRVTPRVTHKWTDGVLADVPADVLEPGDQVEVRAQETFPADGVVREGTTSADFQVLTGESRPTVLTVGDRAAAGTVNLGAAVRLEVTEVGDATRIGAVLRDVERSAGQRPGLVQLADRIGGWFVGWVLLAASITFATWMVLDPAVAVDHSVALLIVACPCALGLATPLALSVALGKAARRRILIKGGDVLQQLSSPGELWLDKTGTLTRGEMGVTEWSGDLETLGLLAAVERQASHPIARAVVQHARERGCPSREARAVEQSERGGITGIVEGRRVVAGNAPFVTERTSSQLPADGLARATRCLERGASPLFVAVDGVVVAVAGLGDPLRDDAEPSIRALRARGWQVGILSGDHPSIVRATGEALGLDPARCHGGLQPADKVAFVQRTETQPRRVTVMVGDGVNDSAALVAATVGIAVRDGAEASLRAAPVYIGTPGLIGVVELLEGADATLRCVRRNLGVSLAYNLCSVGLAAAGLINPLVAAVLMPLSSLSVVATSLSLRWKKVPS